MRRASDAYVERQIKQCRTSLSANLWGIMCLALILRHITRRLGGACWGGGTWCDWHDEEEVFFVRFLRLGIIILRSEKISSTEYVTQEPYSARGAGHRTLSSQSFRWWSLFKTTNWTKNSVTNVSETFKQLWS